MLPDKTRAGLSVAAAAALLFLLFYSAPHRVHHFFDGADTGPCPVFAVTQSCDVDSTAPAAGVLAHPPAAVKSAVSETWVPYFSPSPSSQRAPPPVRLSLQNIHRV